MPRSAKELLEWKDRLDAVDESEGNLAEIEGTKSDAPTNSEEEIADIARRRDGFFDDLRTPRIKQLKHFAQAEFCPATGLSKITKAAGKRLQWTGFLQDGVHFLHPEEAVFMLDSGDLELLWPCGASFSVQQAFSEVLGGRVSTARYVVFARLKRLGYTVRRHDPELMASTEAYRNPRRPPKRPRHRSENHQQSGDQSDSQESSTGSPKPKSSLDSAFDVELIQRFWSAAVVAAKNSPCKPSYTPFGRELLDKFPDSGGGPLTVVRPLGPDCMPQNVTTLHRRLLDSRQFDKQGEKKTSSRGGGNRFAANLRPAHWRVIPERVRSQAADWLEYRRIVDDWLADNSARERCIQKLSGGGCPPLLADPGDLAKPAEAIRKLDVIKAESKAQSGDSGETGAARRVLEYAYDVYLPGSDFCLTLPTKPNHRLVILQQSDGAATREEVAALKAYTSDGRPAHIAVVDGAQVVFQNFDLATLPRLYLDRVQSKT